MKHEVLYIERGETGLRYTLVDTPVSQARYRSIVDIEGANGIKRVDDELREPVLDGEGRATEEVTVTPVILLTVFARPIDYARVDAEVQAKLGVTVPRAP